MALAPKLPPAIYVDSARTLATLIRTLANEDQIAVDTESNNMYAYRGRVCLIQVSTRDRDYIVDPLAIGDIQPFGEILADPSIEKIFHAAEYDLICLKRDFDFDVDNLFDTMVAARLTGVQKFGLGDLLSEHFDIRVDKSHQLDNWGKRPLPKDSLVYAQMDTHYLHDLRDTLHEDLTELQRLEEAQEAFDDVLRIEVSERTFDPNGFWKLGRPSRLTRRQMALLRELYLLREELAEAYDRPPFKVMTNKTLINISRERPSNFKNLKLIKGINGRMVREFGDDILEAIEKGIQSDVPSQPPRDEPDPILAERYTALHAWRKDTAVARGLDSSLIVTKQTLWNLAHSMPQTHDELARIEGMGKWRIEAYGDDILRVIKTLR